MNGRTSEERRSDVRPRALLALEDGTIFEGVGFGRAGETTGEVVFNTALCGYQEVLTDPSYAGQIVTSALTRHLRTHGAKRGVVSALDPDRDSLVGKARGSRSMVGLDLAREVSCAKPWAFDPRAEAK